MIGPFQLSCNIPTVHFGAGGALSLATRLEELRVQRALVACTASGAQRYADVLAALGDRLACTYANAQPHCPIDIARSALEQFNLNGCDCVVTIGGGSSIGLGKYIAVETGTAHVALPTTLSGSEMTPLFGVLVDGQKRSRRDIRALARAVVVDPKLALTLPLRETAATGMNALAHCIEAMYMPGHSPITDMLAQQGVQALAHALDRLATAAADEAARTEAAYGALLGGLLVNSVGIGLHHRLCHVLGGRFGAPHGETNGVILPHVLAFNWRAMGTPRERLLQALGAAPATSLQNLARKLGAPTSLRELGVDPAALPEVAREVMQHLGPNPRSVHVNDLVALLERAWEGSQPLEDSHGR